MIHFVMMETTRLNATLMEVLVATIATQHGIISALSVNALKNDNLLRFKPFSRFL